MGLAVGVPLLWVLVTVEQALVVGWRRMGPTELKQSVRQEGGTRGRSGP